jgi:hypothetical protein
VLNGLRILHFTHKYSVRKVLKEGVEFMSIQGELKRCMKELYPDIYPDLYFDIRLHGSKKNEGLIQDEETEKVLYVNAKEDGNIFYGEAIPDGYTSV